MTDVERLASFVVRARLNDLSNAARGALKIRILDSLGCAFGALGAPLLGQLRVHLEDFGGAERWTVIGRGRTAADRAAFYNDRGLPVGRRLVASGSGAESTRVPNRAKLERGLLPCLFCRGLLNASGARCRVDRVDSSVRKGLGRYEISSGNPEIERF